MKEIIIGALSSLIASLIWFFSSRIIAAINSRKKINHLLETLYDCADQFDSAIKFKMVDVAERQVDKIIELYYEIKGEILFFTFFSKKKKLFNTILYNLYYTVSYYKRLWVGYNEEDERKSVLEKFKRKYYYNIKTYYKDKSEDYVSFLIFSVPVLQALNQNNCVKKSLLNNYSVHNNCNLYETYSTLIAVKNFKDNRYYNRYDLQKDIFTKEEYELYLRKKLGCVKS